MTLKIENGRVIHYPTGDKFAFDGEVALIFPDMARRSIPLYDEVHRMHASLLSHVWDTKSAHVVDVGASRGEFFRAICNQLQCSERHPPSWLRLTAIDSSPHMMARLKDDMPKVEVITGYAQDLQPLEHKADVISMFYILQFIEADADKLKALRWAADNLKPGGVLLLGQKDTVTHTYDAMFTREYHNFRRRNGYTIEIGRAHV